MAGSEVRSRSRRATELLLGGYVSSGSEHEAADLSGVLDGFFFSDEENSDEFRDYSDEESEKNPCNEFESFPTAMMVKDLLHSAAADPFAAGLAAYAASAAERLAALRPNRAAFTRALMTSLRDSGYNAGVCKARWESRGGITGGNYEYVDVISEESHQNKQRYILEADFREKFEIARPTAEYERILEELPRVYAGKTEELKRIIRLLGDAAKRSLQSREMHVPPWRKGRYMQTKWLGDYLRTMNPNPTLKPALSFTSERDEKCRLVGFHAAPILAPLPAAKRAR